MNSLRPYLLDVNDSRLPPIDNAALERSEQGRQRFLSGAAPQVSNKPLNDWKIRALWDREARFAAAAEDRPVNELRPIKYEGVYTVEIQGGTLRVKYRAAGGNGQRGRAFERGWNDRPETDDDLGSEYPADFIENKLPPVKRGNKNKVTSFSSSSRNNLLDTLNSIESKAWYTAKFLTLTYHEEIPTHERAYRDLDVLYKRLERYVEKWNKKHPDRAYDVSAIWRMEVKPRLSGLNIGEPAPHFHLFLFNCPYIPQPTLLRWWQEITGDKTIDRVEIKRVDNRLHASVYMAKYTAKNECEAGTPAYLVLALYLTDGGRLWGVFGRSALPNKTIRRVVVPIHFQGINKFIEFCEGNWKFLNDRWSKGFRVFCFDGLDWLHEVLDECFFADLDRLLEVEN